MKLWGGRFTKETDELVNRFNASITFDKRFFKQDILGSIAHVTMLEKQGIAVAQYSFPTVKPIDRETILACANEFEHIFTVEEHNITGGFGSAVAEVMVGSDVSAKLHRLGINDVYCEAVGTQAYLRDCVGISAEGIAKAVAEAVG